MVIILFQIMKRSDIEGPAYRACTERMHRLIEDLPGYISTVEFEGEDGSEINLVRFETLEALENCACIPITNGL